ncbi:non-ribosomal peptide synthetase protein [Rutstroemia sp. NJR-2017a BBW]|nr:non-ribosomal peptide synthetase protein [Rutstroemia sp. NJR-2017a BBW]
MELPPCLLFAHTNNACCCQNQRPSQLQGTESSSPISLQKTEIVIENATLCAFSASASVEVPHVFLAIWALVLACYTGADHVQFGLVREEGKDEMVVLQYDENEAFEAILGKVEDGIHEAAERGTSNSRVLYNTVVDVCVCQSIGETRAVERARNLVPTLSLCVDVSESEVRASLISHSLCGNQLAGIAATFSTALATSLEHSSVPVGSLPILSAYDRNRLQHWNGLVPQPACPQFVHEILTLQARNTPESIAVQSWEGNMTYSDLEEVSSRLAVHLRQLGVGTEVMVPLCFGKSMWTVISQVAVLKAGGACVPIDPNLPRARMEIIMKEVAATIALTSVECSGLLPITSDVTPVIVNDAFVASLPLLVVSKELIPNEQLKGSNAAFIMFTSGSTGIPKGIVQEHRHMTASIEAHTARMSITPSSRLFQFSSYAFDVSISDIFGAFLHGACLCIPSDADRVSALAKSITELRATHICTTPTVAKTLDPKDVPTLSTMTLGGEKLTQELVEIWSDKVKLLNIYGVTECSVWCAINERERGAVEPENIGYGVGGVLWVVEPHNHDVLVPIGALGELVIEGPIVARGYLDPEKTKKVFIAPPAWVATAERAGEGGNMYKTGDLVRQNCDGSLSFVGRKDTQAKLRGQRLELEDVEHHLARCMMDAPTVAVEIAIVQMVHGTEVEALIAFVQLPGSEKPLGLPTRLIDITLADELMPRLVEVEAALAKVLPGYMIPTVFLPVQKMPTTDTGKLNRRRLRELAASLSPFELRKYSLPYPGAAGHGKRAPQPGAESRLADAWAEALRVPVTLLSAEDHFFHVGGDSVRAMTLAAKAQQRGLPLTVATIFETPILADMASRVDVGAGSLISTVSTPTEFELLPAQHRDEMVKDAAEQCGISVTDIEDMYPCTPLQEGFMATSSLEPDAYVTTYKFDLPADLDVGVFRRAWEHTAVLNPILRTQMVQIGSFGMFQIVLKHTELWKHSITSSGLLGRFGGPLHYAALLDEGAESPQTRKFTWSAHHAVYDGWTLPLLMDCCQRCYKELTQCEMEQERARDDAPVKFSPFLRYLAGVNHDELATFWTKYCSGFAFQTFPSLPQRSYQPRPRDTAKFTRNLPTQKIQGITLPTFINLAWALTLRSYQSSDDIVFGLTTSGRSAPIDGILTMMGPTIATFPLRIQVSSIETVQDALKAVQRSLTSIIPFEQTGLQNIRRISDDAAATCAFQNLLVIQPEVEDSLSGFLSTQEVDADFLNDLNVYSLMLECSPRASPDGSSSIDVMINFDREVIEPQQVQRVFHQFAGILTQLLEADSSEKIDHLCFLSVQDREEIMQWNSNVPAIQNRCIHELIAEAYADDLQCPAICSWDGNLSFAELDHLSSQFSQQLWLRGVKKGDFVPLCFEKSLWIAVAMLAVLKAGAAFVMLSPQHPKARLQAIAEDAKAKFVVCSKTQGENFTGTSLAIIELGPAYPAIELESSESLKTSFEPVSPEDAAIVIYTSGSTGKPKGIILEHLAFCSSAMAHGLSECLSRNSHVLQFADFAFDVALSDILTTLIYGGCVCIPSEDQRMNDLAGVIRDLGVTDAFLTPTVSRMLMPSDVPLLRTLKLGGEPLQQEDLNLWAEHVYLINSYGVAECCVRSLYHAPVSVNDKPSTIGQSVGCTSWIVNIDDSETLAPIGAIGELLIEGPTLMRGYLHDDTRTSEAIVDRKLGRPTARRMYRSGDLVRYDSRRAIEFIGRKDTQVKIRGQRIELGEIEHHLAASLGGHQSVAVESINSSVSFGKLVAFIVSPNAQVTSHQLLAPPAQADSALYRSFVKTRDQLSQKLPQYMIPDMFVSINFLPLNPSGKTDRRRLRDTIADLLNDKETAAHYQLGYSEKTPLTLPEHHRLAELWSRVMKLNSAALSADDNFFRLGGDSVQAMRLVAAARAHGYSLSVAGVFQHPILSEQAKLLGLSPAESATDREELKPFEILLARATIVPGVQSYLEANQIRQEVAADSCIKEELIMDAYPCTPLQEGLMALSIIQRGAYIYQHVYDLPLGISLSRFQCAWQRLVDQNNILRTVIVRTMSWGLVQVVLKPSPLTWLRPTSLDSYVKSDKEIPMGYSEPLSRFALCADHDGRYQLVWTIHHALYDGWSMDLIVSQLNLIYDEQEIAPAVPFGYFVAHLQHLNKAAAATYWTEYLAEGTHSPFPVPKATDGPRRGKRNSVEGFLSTTSASASDFTLTTVVRFAWALLLSKYIATDDVIFASTVSGRNEDLTGIENLVGPTIASVPFRVKVDQGATVAMALGAVQSASANMIPFEQMGMQNISRLNPSTKELCNPFTLLVVHPEDRRQREGDVLGKPRNADYDVDFLTYPLAIECSLSPEGLQFNISSSPSHLSFTKTEWILFQLKEITAKLLNENQKTALVGELDIISPEELDQVQKWNHTVPEAELVCVHEKFSRVAARFPLAEAVCAWDGSLTYVELDQLSNRVALFLIDRGVQKGSHVPVLFEKSVWAIVSQLAVLKAGAVCVPLDISHPVDRKRFVLGAIGSDKVLTSESLAEYASQFSSDTIVIGSSVLPNLPDYQLSALTLVEPSQPAFVLFTSGTTGTPKGIEIPHATTCSSANHHGPRLRLNETSRVLQFSSFVFDVAIFDIYTTLFAGGCVCLPRESDRFNGIPAVVESMKINWALLTPSFVRTLNPSELRGLRTLVLGGEAVPTDLVTTWQNELVLINAYGPTEGSTCVAGNFLHGVTSDTIGKAVGCLTWIVNHHNHDVLAPLGTIGELLIEGPVLAKGYLNDEHRTEKSFIFDPIWSGKADTNRRRFYQTGDLVQYLDDGSLRYVGRKDTQVKINGQRIEMEEVEHHLRQALGVNAEVAVDVVKPKDSIVSILVAFIRAKSAAGTQYSLLIQLAQKYLTRQVPSYMIPSGYVQLVSMPMTITGKRDRLTLRELAQAMTISELKIGSEEVASKRMPEGRMELFLAESWARVLQLKIGQIGADDSFFELGGDSIAAIHLAAHARRAAFSLTVGDIFNKPRLCDMATAVEALDSASKIIALKPFELLGTESDGRLETNAIRSTIALQCGVDATFIQDAYPCTPLQQALIASSARVPGSYHARYIFTLPARVNRERFCRAWDQVFEKHPILRTRIIQLDSTRTVQVIVDETISWKSTDNLKDYIESDQGAHLVAGGPLTRFAFVFDETTATAFFIWTIHHALFDGWSLQLLLQDFERAYATDPVVTPADFRMFVKLTEGQNQRDSSAYWAKNLEDASPPCFPSVPSAGYQPLADRCIRLYTHLPRKSQSTITNATLIRAAWSLVMARYSNSEDVVFGSTLSGRGAPVAGIDQMTGPTITTVPIRVLVRNDQTLGHFLQELQHQAQEMIPHEQFGLRNIQFLGTEIAEACNFRTLLIVQPLESKKELNSTLNLPDEGSDIPGFHTTPLVIDCLPTSDGVATMIDFDSHLLSEVEVRRIFKQFSHVLQQCAGRDGATPISSIEIISQEDREQIQHWNRNYPRDVEELVHSLVERQAVERPNQTAIQSWDGVMTYQDLCEVSSHIAVVLRNLGKKPGVIVPICFEKSRWAVVSMLAILKAGGACLPLDPSHPVARHQTILKTVRASLVLTSSAHAPRLRTFMENVLVVSEIADRVVDSVPVDFQRPSPHDPAFIMFTSGSTGVPKGIVLEHHNICTTTRYHGAAMQISSKSRVLQFAAYSFDVSLGDIFTTLVHGGCVCVPSDEQRLNDLPGAIVALGVNQACLTSSVARNLPVDTVRGRLDVLTLGGEPLANEVVDAFAEHTHLLNIYGPAECSVWCACTQRIHQGHETGNIGRGVGARLWISDLTNSSRLAPIGCVGELMIEGPVVARGYLFDEKKTQGAFLTDLAYLPGEQLQAYRTGDLARYSLDGSVVILGRKDQQVKLRGQRIELGEIEHHLQSCVPTAQAVAVDVFMQNRETANHALVAFICPSSKEDGLQSSKMGNLTDIEYASEFAKTKTWQDITAGLRDRLAGSLPPYCIPHLCIPLRALPLSTSGKLDRKKLRETASELSTSQARLSLQQKDKKPLTTFLQKCLGNLWVKLLGIDLEYISADQHFFQLGGDSITAMQLVAAARAEGMAISTVDIFNFPVLEDMAQQMQSCDSLSVTQIMPFSLIQKTCAQNVRQELAALLHVKPYEIEDAYPCSPLQEGLMALSMKRRGDFIFQQALPLPQSLDTNRFQAAWTSVVAQHPILRSRIIQLGSSFIQVVVNNQNVWHQGTDLSVYLQELHNNTMVEGVQLLQLALIEEATRKWFVWVVHHAIYDAWSQDLMIDEVEAVYCGRRMTANPYQFNHFINYVTHAHAEEAKEFWSAELEGASSSSFPFRRSKAPAIGDRTSQNVQYTFSVQNSGNFTMPTLLRAAWALIIARYSSSQDVTFGATVSGRDTPIPGIDQIMGPTVTTVPVRVNVDDDSSVDELLWRIQRQTTALVPFQHYGLSNIAQCSESAAVACDFTSLLILQPRNRDGEKLNELAFLQGDGDAVQDLSPFNVHPLMVQCENTASAVKVSATFDSLFIDASYMNRILQQFGQLVAHLTTVNRNVKLGDVDILDSKDYTQIYAWNEKVPETPTECIHELFSKQVSLTPQKLAIEAWDGNLSYADLEMRASQLAAILRGAGVKTETFVIICIEKSLWAFVAMLAVLKAGGTCVPVNVNDSNHRLSQVISGSNSKLALVSPTQSSRLENLGVKAILIDACTCNMDTCNMEDPQPRFISTDAISSHAAFVIYTSGSTGTPKGIVIEHATLIAGGHAETLNLGSDSRVFQFSSFTFDIGIFDVVTTLIRGGTICVPSETERVADVAAAIQRYNANWAYLTPSVLRTIDPRTPLPLQTLALGGEAVGQDNVDLWAERVQLMNGYGPTEASICVAGSIPRGHPASVLGRPVGSCVWIVDATCHQRLAPIGSLGELLVEGPVLARGYLGNDELTNAFFISAPAWMHPERSQTRLYRTGDIGYYELDGSISYVGRRDTQVKIRGQRVELEEVEYRARQLLPSGIEIAVDVANFQSDTEPRLTAFMTLPQDAPISTVWMPVVSQLVEILPETLPRYMVPTMFLPLPRLPYNSSGKIDRRALRQQASAIPIEEAIRRTRGASSSNSVVPTDQEQWLMDIWARVLRVDRSSITPETNFFLIGGDSVSAMKIASIARNDGQNLLIGEIFAHPILARMAKRCSEAKESMEVRPFALTKAPIRDELMAGLEKDGRGNPETIEDIYPCTPFQEAVLALSLKSREGAFLAQDISYLPAGIDMVRFKSAWESVVTANPIMRTIICQTEAGDLFQVVLKKSIDWKELEGLDSYVHDEKAHQITVGQSLTHFAIVTEKKLGKVYFVWTVHHALYDGFTIALILDQVETKYFGKEGQSLLNFNSYAGFLQQTSKEMSQSFWRENLAGISSSQFPSRATVLEPQPDASNELIIAGFRNEIPGITTPTLIRTALAILISRHTSSRDVCFGEVSSGRNALVKGIDRIAGPTLCTVPVRMILDHSASLRETAQTVQDSYLQRLPFEHLGLSSIAKVSHDAASACQFQTVLLIQPAKQLDIADPLGLRNVSVDIDRDLSLFNTHALMLECAISDDQIVVTANYDGSLLDEKRVLRYLAQFESLLGQLSSLVKSARRLNAVDMVTGVELDEILAWNGSRAQVTLDTVHSRFQHVASAYPDSQAICSWDGNLTYKELNDISTQFAYQLQSHGLQPGQFVPLCCEKSLWATVAMISVLKAGGICSFLDPAHPTVRLKRILQDLQASFAITTREQRSVLEEMVKVVVIDSETGPIQSSPTHPLPDVQPDASAFVVWTSGSTGIPKGIVLEHAAICTSIAHHGKAMKFTSHSRVFQFAAYTFDVSISDTFSTLLNGGCLCVPSDLQRLNSLACTIRDLHANQACLTSTVAELLRPSEVPCLQNLTIGGEALSRINVQNWAGATFLTNIYGPAEASMWCMGNIGLGPDADETNIGTGLGVRTWITDVEDPNRLCSIGMVGELLLEGPLLARGYLNNPENTTKAFITNPAWATEQIAPPGTRFYRTGDLVCYKEDGSVKYVGRKDSQAKIHGQRIELGEIEHNIHLELGEDVAVVVLVGKLRGQDRDTLVAVLGFRDLLDGEEGIATTTATMHHVRPHVKRIRAALRQTLPRYMIPEIFLPIKSVPVTPSGKSDRLRLREMISQLSDEQVLRISRESDTEFRPPVTTAQLMLRTLWAEILGVPEESIGLDDDFLGLGGDSISAIKLTAQARVAGFHLTVATVFKHPTLIDMTREALVRSSSKASRDIVAMSDQDYQSIEREAFPIFAIDKLDVEGIVPATDYQAEAVAAGLMPYRGYVNYFTFDFHERINSARLRDACIAVLRSNQILRTVFIVWRRTILQVVYHLSTVECQVEDCTDTQDVERYLTHEREEKLMMGDRFCRFYIFKMKEGRTQLVLRISHAQYDGLSFPRISEDLISAYSTGELPIRTDVTSFQHQQYVDEAAAKGYWTKLLHASNMTRLVDHDRPSWKMLTSETLRRRIKTVSSSDSSITFATMLKAAWAMVLARVSGDADVVFGYVSSGRNAPHPGILNLCLPCMAIVPVRVFVKEKTCKTLLQELQTQHIWSLEHELFGWRNIVETCTDWRPWTRFSSIVQHQNIDNILGEFGQSKLPLSVTAKVSKADAADITIYSVPEGDMTTLEIGFCPEIIPDQVARLLLDDLCDNLQHLAGDGARSALLAHPLQEILLPSSCIPTNGSLVNWEEERAELCVDTDGPLHATQIQARETVKQAWYLVMSAAGTIQSHETQQALYGPESCFYDEWGELLAAAALAAHFSAAGYEVEMEDVLKKPTVAQQEALLSLQIKHSNGK